MGLKTSQPPESGQEELKSWLRLVSCARVDREISATKKNIDRCFIFKGLRSARKGLGFT